MSSQEIPLQGGNITGAVRVGNTVRRASGPWSPAVHSLLQHLEQPHALIDFDYAGPGPRAWDMAYAAYRFVPLMHIENQELQPLGLTDPQMQKQRLQRFCMAYGISTTKVLALVEPRLQALCTTIITSASADNPAFQKMLAEGHLAFYQREIAAFHRSRSLYMFP